MNVTINSQVLAQEVRLLEKATLSKSTIAILGHILLRADDQLYLSAYDMEVGMSTVCQSTISETGIMTLPAKPLLDMLDRLPNADVIISGKGEITCGSFHSRLASLPALDFPAFPQQEGEVGILSAQALRSLVERTVYAISDKEQKYVLKGALLSLTGEVIAMVATDGKRLSVATAARPAGPEGVAIVPLKTLGIILDQAPVGEVKFSRSDRHLFFDFGRRLLISRVVDGEYPKYQRIIPKTNENIVKVDRAALAAALRRVGLVAEVLSLSLGSGEIALSSRSVEIGDAEETVPAEYSGQPIRVNLNWKFLLDFLDHATESVITIAAKNGGGTLLLTDGADFINVIVVVK
jgi:DNA polymerase-3 subunit beta